MDPETKTDLSKMGAYRKCPFCKQNNSFKQLGNHIEREHKTIFNNFLRKKRGSL